MSDAQREARAPQAVVDVEDDPRQVQALVDDQVRVYETELDPGAATALHRHSRHTVIVFLTGGRLRCASNRHRHPAPGIGRGIHPLQRVSIALRFALRHRMRAVPGLVTIRSTAGLPAVHRLHADARNTGPIRFVGVELGSGGGRPGPTTGMRNEYADDTVHVLRLPERGESTAHLPRGGVLVCASAPGTASGPRLTHVPERGFARLEPGDWRFAGPSAVLVVA